jgi:death on curing protein
VSGWRYLTTEEAIYLHRELMLEEGQSAVLIAPDKLESALQRPQSEAFGEEFFPTLAEKAAVLLQGIVVAHPFMDGNKRIGFAAMMTFLRVNGISANAESDALYDFVIAVTTGELREVEDIAARLSELFAPHLDAP